MKSRIRAIVVPVLHNRCDGGGKRCAAAFAAWAQNDRCGFRSYRRKGLQKRAGCALPWAMIRPASLLFFPLLLTAASPANARESLGVFESWGAFRDPSPARCYAIAMPVKKGGRDGFATISHWPAQRIRGQVQFRLSRGHGQRTPVTLSIGDRRFALVAGAADAWAADARGDAAIVAAIRSGTSMSVETRDAGGRAYADTYALRGAATAIDAAALGCARRG